jgi:hypothetical protein
LRFRPKGLEGESEARSEYGVLYGVRGVSKNFPGLLLLFAMCFKGEAKELRPLGFGGRSIEDVSVAKRSALTNWCQQTLGL